jgi:2-hydroxy-3-keto-5-methylthiopentenyl-1-phosphate phosphatase
MENVNTTDELRNTVVYSLSQQHNVVTDASNNSSVDKELIFTLLKQNQEFKELIIEQNKELSNRFIEQSNAIMELAKKETNIVTNNTINNNQKFNLNLFLYEKCKDALNLTEFINSLEIGMEQLEYMGEYGYVNAISKVIIDKLNEMDVYKRPIHCTDIKRDTIYVKENDQWMKDTDDNKFVRKLIDKVGTGHNKMLCVWQDINPKCVISDTFLCKLWFKLTKECINTGAQGVRNDNEIIKNIANAVYLDRGRNILSKSEPAILPIQNPHIQNPT